MSQKTSLKNQFHKKLDNHELYIQKIPITRQELKYYFSKELEQNEQTLIDSGNQQSIKREQQEQQLTIGNEKLINNQSNSQIDVFKDVNKDNHIPLMILQQEGYKLNYVIEQSQDLVVLTAINQFEENFLIQVTKNKFKKNSNQLALIQLNDKLCNTYSSITQQTVSKNFCPQDREYFQENKVSDNRQIYILTTPGIFDSEQIKQDLNRVKFFNFSDEQRKNLNCEDLSFLQSIFKLGKYYNSEGEVDVFLQRQKNQLFRVVKINSQQDDFEDFQSKLKQAKQLLLEKQYNKNKDDLHFVLNKKNQQKYLVAIFEVSDECFVEKLQDIQERKIFNLSLQFFETFQFMNQYATGEMQGSSCNYSDTFSVGQSLKNVLDKLYIHENIKKRIIEQVNELLQGFQNSVDKQSFQLPIKFINTLIDQQNPQINVILENFLELLEKFFIKKKGNKKLYYTFEYAEIALLILNSINLNIEKKKSNQIKLKALLAKSYIYQQRELYQDSLNCIQLAQTDNLFQQNCSEDLLTSIKLIVKIAIKQNKISQTQKLNNSLLDFIEKCQNRNGLDSLFLSILHLQLRNLENLEFTHNTFYEETIDEEQKFNIICKMVIKYIKYFKDLNLYNHSFYPLIGNICQQEIEGNSYYYLKLLKKLGIYLYSFLFKNRQILDKYDFFLEYPNEILLLPQIIIKYFDNIQSKKINEWLDIETCECYYIISDLKNGDFYEFYFSSHEQIKDLIEKYKQIIPLQKNSDCQKLPIYQEQIFRKNEQQQENQKQDEKRNLNSFQFTLKMKNQNKIIKQFEQIMNQLASNLPKQEQTIKQNNSTQNQTSEDLEIIKYFDCQKFNLSFIGSEFNFQQSIHSFPSQINCYEIILENYFQQNYFFIF